MRSKKCFIVFIFVFAVFSVIGVSFSAYIIHGNNVDEIVQIKPNDISVINEKQNFLTYAGNKGIETYDNDIVNDTFSVYFQLNQKKYHDNTNNISIKSGLGIELSFTSSTLFNHVKDDVKNEFINLSYGENYNLSMQYGENYLAGGNSCLVFDSESLTCFAHISFSSDSSGGDFYIQRIAEDNGFANRYSTVVGGQEMDFIWSFNLNFNFEIIDKSVGYSKEFDINSFGNVSVELIFEDYR